MESKLKEISPEGGRGDRRRYGVCHVGVGESPKGVLGMAKADLLFVHWDKTVERAQMCPGC